ncbi:gamma-glutamyltransferase family protein [Streptomyces sp. NPDC001520]|uniref:gamma-glutamyltransferase family protein n=1 Tax=Streptomyces sp. NPDC001520 TaxID=3364581 RepID=UPI0036BE827C
MALALMQSPALALPQSHQTEEHTFSEDFSKQSTGSLPAGWTPAWGAGQSWKVVNRDRDRELSAEGAAYGHRTLRWDTPGDTADGEVLALMSSTAKSGTQLGVMLRTSGAAGSERGYSMDLGGKGLRIHRWLDGARSAVGPHEDVGFMADTWYWMRFRAHGTQMQGKAWEAGTPEPPAWSIERTDSRIRTAGGIALDRTSTSGTMYTDYVSATTGSNSAPLPATAPGSHDYVPYQVGNSNKGMVSSFEPLATKAGQQMLQHGGNAVDAAVATAFALAVVEPSMSSIGGRTQIVIRRPSGHHVGIDGATQVPLGYDGADSGGTGYKTIALPGTVAALAQAQERYGRKPLAEVMALAIDYARDGFVLPTGEATRLAEAADDLLPTARGYFLKPGGVPYEPGETLKQSDLADVLTAIAKEGPDVFYKGWIADRIVRDMRANGGYIKRPELNDYAAKPATEVTSDYRGYHLTASFRPASGHQTIEALNIMGQFDMPTCAPNAPWASITHQALQRANNDKLSSPGATDEESAAILTSKSYAAKRSLNMTDHCPRLTGGTGSGAGEPEGPADPPGTTSLSTADSQGGMVALTQSIGDSMGSQVATRGLGFMWASTMGYVPGGPGSRPRTGQTPMIVEKNGHPVLALGGAGGAKIVPAVVETLTRHIDQGLSLPDAIAAPRQYNAGETEMELEDDPGLGVHWPDSVVSDLRGMGYSVHGKDSAHFGRVAAIHFDAATGVYTGVTDPRKEGSVSGP